MAGGKETPRQKMVGMMYLVLTALLALQVSNAVLDKFFFIDESLQHSIREARKDNDKLIKGIEEAVNKAGNRPQDLLVKRQTVEIIGETSVLLTEMESIRKEIIEITGGVEENGGYKGAKSYDEVMALMLGPGDSKSGKAYQLKEKLNQYAKKISQYDSSLHIEPIALDASEIEKFKKDENQKNKDFAHLNFEQTPMVAALAILSHIQTEVVKAETKALSLMASKVGAEDIRFDKVLAVVSPDSKEVAWGTPYKARMRISATSSQFLPVMTSTAGKVSVNADGEGEVQFIADATGFDETGRAKRVWKGSITIKTPKGDSTFTVEEEYYVVKPVMQIQSASVQALYLNCGNEINVAVPSLGSSFDPEYTVEGGSANKGGRRGLVTLIPNKGSFKMKVSSKGNTVGEETFRVKKVPLPTIAVYNSNKLLDQRNGGAMPRTLNVKALPDTDFQSFLPKDARYRVTEWEVTLARGKSAIETIKSTSESISLNSMASKARPGDRLIVEVKKTQRLNFLNQTENVVMETVYMFYPIIN